MDSRLEQGPRGDEDRVDSSEEAETEEGCKHWWVRYSEFDLDDIEGIRENKNPRRTYLKCMYCGDILE